MNKNPIGVFDSGLGGLSVWKELIKVLPEESFIYFADSGNCPYGQKSAEEITALSARIVDFLLAKNCKMIVVACNTATSAAIKMLRANYLMPIIGMEPAVKPAALLTKTGAIGVIATQQTLRGELFKETSQKYAQNIEVIIQIGYGLVDLIEAGKAGSKEAEELLRKYLLPMMEKNIDQIVLGSTHYPFLIPLIQKITAGKVNIINPAIAVAKHTKNVLLENHLQTDNTMQIDYQFFSSADNLDLLQNFVKDLLEGFKPSANYFWETVK